MIKLYPLEPSNLVVQKYINEILIKLFSEKEDAKKLLCLFIRKEEINWKDFIKDLVLINLSDLKKNKDYRIDFYLEIKEWQRNSLPSEYTVGVRANRKEREDSIEKLNLILNTYREDINIIKLFLNGPDDKLNEQLRESILDFNKMISQESITNNKIFQNSKRNLIKSLDRYIEELFDYNLYIDRTLKAEILCEYKTEICPYCNRQKINIVKSEESQKYITTADFEHFLPVSEFPLFQLSIWNVLPSCLVCNRNFKKAKILDLLNPIEEGFENHAKFNIKNSDFYMNPSIDVEYLLEVDQCCPDQKARKIENNISLFSLHTLYQTESYKYRANKIGEFYKKYKRLIKDSPEKFKEYRDILFDYDQDTTDFRNINDGKFNSDIEKWLTQDDITVSD